MRAITEELLKSFRERIRGDRQIKTLQAAVAKTEMKDIAYLPQEAARLEGPFAIELKTRGITAQMKSGRCWCFAGLNILREIVAEKLGLEEFRLSANYLTFYDKLEKCNNYLEMIIANAGCSMDDRMMDYLARGIGDGGYWDMVADLVKKYGAVPAANMPETFQSEHTEILLRLINNLLKKDAVILRKAVAEGQDTAALKDEMMAEIYRSLVILFGEPVEVFDFTYRDKQGEYHIDRGLTPKNFYEKYIGCALDDYITVVNEPTHRVPFGRTYTFHYTGSMAESRVLCLNLTAEEMKDLTVRQLRDGEPVWFGCDSAHCGDRLLGIWDPASFDYEGLLGGVDLSMSKTDRLEFHEARATHAMIFTGVNFDKDGAPDRWKIENSWGGEVGRKGYFVCSDRYFDEYVFEVIINRKHLNEAQKALLEAEPIRLEPWMAY